VAGGAGRALLAPVPIVTAMVAWLEWRSLSRADSEAGAFFGAVALFALSIVFTREAPGLLIGLFR